MTIASPTQSIALETSSTVEAQAGLMMSALACVGLIVNDTMAPNGWHPLRGVGQAAAVTFVLAVEARGQGPG
eukprot:8834005-Lingulodinium_polyedra.AAC.1